MTINKKSKPLVDLATIITILGILFYFFGFIYSCFFYSELGIKESLIDLSMNKILFTTWQVPILLVITFIFTYINYFFRRLHREEINILETAVSIISSFGLLWLSLWLSENVDVEYRNIYVIAFGIITASLLIIASKFKKVKRISIYTFHYIIIVTGIFASCFFYPYMGTYSAKKTIKKYEEDIEIRIKDNNQRIYGKFISYMNDKYILLVEDLNCEKKTLIINNDEISMVYFINKKSK